MTGFRFNLFSGEAPKIPARKLPNHFAQTAKNCDLRNGNLAALKNGLFDWTPTKVGTKTTIYRFADQYWFHWLADVDVARLPVPGDTSERTCFTGDSYPRVTDNSIGVQGGGTNYPTNSYQLGVLPPGNALTATPGAGGGCDTNLETTVAFVYTYVSIWGEEGPPSNASALATICPSQTVDITGMEAGPTGNYNTVSKRIYAAFSGEYQFVAEIPVANSTYSFAWDSSLLGEIIPSTTWDAPPSNMIGLIMLPNGIAIGFAGNELIPSEAFLPHAYPPQYRLTTDYPIVALATAGSSVVVGTTGKPYIVMGTDPSSLSMIKLENNQACVSKRSMVDMGGFVAYASPDGLVAISQGGSASIATDRLMTREQWQALVPESIHAYYWEGAYVGFYDTGAVQGGFIFDPGEEAALRFIDVYATAGFNDLEEDALYLQVGDDIVKWDAGTALTYTWKSKLKVMPKPLSFGAGQVIAATYPVTLKLYADGVLKTTKVVADREGFRIAGGYRAVDWEVEVSGTNEVEEVIIAETMKELAEI